MQERQVKLIMTFKDAQGKRLVRSIANPDERLTRMQIARHMLGLIASGTLCTSNGPVVRISLIKKQIVTDWVDVVASAAKPASKRKFKDIPAEFYQSFVGLTEAKLRLFLLEYSRKVQAEVKAKMLECLLHVYRMPRVVQPLCPRGTVTTVKGNCLPNRWSELRRCSG